MIEGEHPDVQDADGPVEFLGRDRDGGVLFLVSVDDGRDKPFLAELGGGAGAFARYVAGP